MLSNNDLKLINKTFDEIKYPVKSNRLANIIDKKVNYASTNEVVIYS